MPMAAAAVGAAVVGAGASVYAANKQSGAIKDASQAAIAEQRAAREQIRSDLNPWRETGQNALMHVGDLSGANGADAATAAMAGYTQSPGYQWQLEQGLHAVDAGAARRGLLSSGANEKAEMAYGQGLASQDFGTYYNRLSALAGAGQNAAAGQGSATLQTANNIGQTLTSGATADANITGQEVSGITGAINSGLNNFRYGQQQNALMQSTYQPPAGSGYDRSIPLISAATPGATTTYMGPT